jgi:uncharacterized membrane protein YfcA
MFLVGILAGFGSGIFGIGGGTVMVPGMVLLAGIGQHAAHANSLAAVTPIVAVAVIPFVLAGQVDVGLALLLATSSVIGARAGARAMHRLSERQLRTAFAGMLGVVAVQMLVSPSGSLLEPDGLAFLVVGALVGLGGGFASALLGIGGGVVLVPAMAVLLGIPQHLAQGTSLLTMIPIAIMGTRLHQRSGLIESRIIVPLAVGGLAAGFLASNIALGIDEATLRRAFAVYSILIMARLLMRDPLWAAAKGRVGRAVGRAPVPPAG